MFRATLTALPFAVALAAPAIAQDATADLTAVYAAFADRLNADDIDGILELFADNAVFVPAPGQPVSGAEAIGGAMGQFAEISDNFDANVRSFFVSGTTALAIVEWELTGTNADGSDLTLTGTTADVLQQDAEGTCKFIVDNPFGTALAN